MLIAFLFIFILPSFSISLMNMSLTDPFESEEQLKVFPQVNNLSAEDEEYLDNSSISILTKASGDEIYSWFGHSSLLLETPENSLVYDYGVFSFESDNFYKNFIQGKMYYVLMVSYLNQNLGVSENQERTVQKLTLDLTDTQKASIINFLHYNSQNKNRTYLYNFYKDNCATRIRDILNWVADDDFKQWAQNTASVGTFRELSNKSLSRSPIIFWCLNAIQGEAADRVGTRWDDMYLPSEMEKSIIEYNKFGSSTSYLYENTLDPGYIESKDINNHVLMYSIAAFILSLIGLYFKHRKQLRNSRIYGIYNTIIMIFLTVISLAVFYLSFFSSIDAAWYNENLVFLNPISSIVLLISAIRTLKKKKEPMKRLAQFERVSRWYSHSIFVLFVLKLIFNNTLIQNNLNIMIPVYIYFIIQGLFFRTKK